MADVTETGIPGGAKGARPSSPGGGAVPERAEGGFPGVISLDWNGEKRGGWLLTTYEKRKGSSETGGTMNVSGSNPKVPTPALGNEPDLNIPPTPSEVNPGTEKGDIKPFPGKPFVPQDEAIGARSGEGTERQNLNLPGDMIAELERQNLKKVMPEFLQSLFDDLKTLFLPISKSPEH